MHHRVYIDKTYHLIHVSTARRIARNIETFVATRYKLFVQITEARYSYARVHRGMPISRSMQEASGIGNKASEINVHLSASTSTWLSRAAYLRNVDIVRRDKLENYFLELISAPAY
jgi:hypothetical protein